MIRRSKTFVGFQVKMNVHHIRLCMFFFMDYCTKIFIHLDIHMVLYKFTVYVVVRKPGFVRKVRTKTVNVFANKSV